MTPWQAVMATHRVAGMWPLTGERGKRRESRIGRRKGMRNGEVKGKTEAPLLKKKIKETGRWHDDGVNKED